MAKAVMQLETLTCPSCMKKNSRDARKNGRG